MGKVRVLVADDHQIVREGLEKLLQDEYEVVGSVGDGTTLITSALQLRPDVIVADFSMPGHTALEAVREIKSQGFDPCVVVLTMHDDPEYAVSALKEGVLGYVLKNAASAELLSALHEALQGRVWLSPHIAQDVLRTIDSAHEESARQEVELSDRQREILKLLTKGLIAKEIATRLGISPRTVEYHKYRTMRELGIGTTAELIQYAVRKGLDQD